MTAKDSWTRSEIQAFQTTQASILKWKFVVVGAVAATGFGLLPEQKEGSLLALAVLPWLAWYADALYRDYDLRIGTLTAFIRGHRTESWQYEMFLTLDSAASKFPILSMIALLLPTLAVCIVVASIGVLSLSGILQKYWAVPPASHVAHYTLIVSSLVCLVLSVVFAAVHGKIYGALNRRAVELHNQLPEPAPTPANRGIRYQRQRRTRRRSAG
jgi:hypothetical protein